MKLRATKPLALILAVLMVITSMVFVASAETITAGTTLVTYKFTSLDETEKEYYDASLLVGTEQTSSASSADWKGRYADGNRFFGYAFPITGDTMPTAIEFRAQMRGDLLVQVSVDKTNWVTAYSATSRFTPTWMEIDLTAAFYKALAGGTAETLYVRFGDCVVDDDGHGTNVLSSQVARLIMDYSKGETSQGKTYNYSFTTSGVLEKKYLDSTIGVASVDYKNTEGKPGFGRFADNARFFGYAFPLKMGAIPESLTFTGCLSGDFLVQTSLDKTTWTTVAVRDAEKVDVYTGVDYTLDLTEAVLGAWAEGASYDCVYIRVGDNSPSDSYGGNLRASAEATMSIKYPDDAQILTSNVDVRIFRPNTASEATYLHTGLHNNGNLNDTKSVRYADKTNYFIYAYELYTTELPTELTWTATTSQQFYLQLSVDSYHWVDVYKYNGAINENGSGGLAAAARTYDLLSAYNAALKLATESSNMLYLKIGDSHPDRGWGGAVATSADVTLRIEYAPIPEDLTMIDYFSSIQGTNEDGYYLEGGSVDKSNGARYGDCANGVILLYPVTGAGASERILLTMSATQQLHLQVSVDKENWVTAFRYNDLGLLVKNNAGNHQNQFFFPRRERTFDLTPAVQAAAKLAEENGSRDSGLYVRIGDAHPTRVDENGAYTTSTSGAGWGGNVLGDVCLSMAAVDGLGVLANTDNVIVEKVKQVANGNYQFCENEPMLVTDDGIAQGYLGTNIGPTAVSTREDGTKIAVGDGNYYGRASDNSYFVYRYQIPATATALLWSAKLGGAYGVDLAIADENCPEPYNTSLWEQVALYSNDGLNGTSDSSSKSIAYDFSSVDVSAGDKYVYIKISDANDEVGGWGGRVALGSNYPVKMAWEVSVSDEITTAGLGGIALNLKQDFTLIYRPNIPISSTDAVVTIGFAGEESCVIEPEEDGTYRFGGILPQQIADTVVFTLTGTIGGSAPYTYEKEYSVRQYCEALISAMPNDKELVTLLTDILAYGAAAQVVADHNVDDLANANVEPREFNINRIQGAYSTLLYGEANDYAAWFDIALRLNETTELVYAFTAESVEGLQIKVVTMTGEELWFGTDDFIPLSEDPDSYWTIRIPVMPYDYADAYVAYFVKDGVCDTEYRVLCSVNTYIKLNYNRAMENEAALLARLHNYGESVRDYVYSR